jgi:hypothetical protein
MLSYQLRQSFTFKFDIVLLHDSLWLCSAEADRVTGNRYAPGKSDAMTTIGAARSAPDTPIAWLELGTAPGWPGLTRKRSSQATLPSFPVVPSPGPR